MRDTNTPNAEGHCNLDDWDLTTDMYPANCIFFPSEDQSPYYPKSSIMTYQFMDEVNHSTLYGIIIYRHFEAMKIGTQIRPPTSYQLIAPYRCATK